MQIQPYLFFDGRCEEALSFYRGALGGEVTMLMRFKDSPEPAMNPPGMGGKVMHAEFRVGGNTLFASDGNCGGRPTFQGVSLSLTLDSIADAERVFAKLGEKGQVQMPMTQTFFSPRFGMVADRFGVSWMVMAAQQQ